MKKKNKKVNAAILIIGNEILSGRTQDKNVAFIANWLNSKCGISVNEVRVIPDIEKIIVKNILDLSKKFNYVFTTGGIGPTHDDITAQSISKAFKVKYEFHKEAFDILENYYGKSQFNDGRRKMAKMPRGSRLIYNPSSAAPSNISKQMGIIQKKFNKFVDIGSYPFFRLGKIGVSVVCRSTSLNKLKKVNQELIKMIKLKKIKILKI